MLTAELRGEILPLINSFTQYFSQLAFNKIETKTIKL